jgi:serine/threonine-protein kinase
VPKLLDFGIARLLAHEATATATSDKLLTFRYASPEQIRGDAVGTASDVYSLAVVLYRLLTGQFPYALEDASAAELARAALDDTPRTPSRSLTARSGAERSDVQALSRQLTGDVDAILLRALRKQPQERYASVAQFADDLRRHLAGLPVMARQGQRGYALRSFVRRHRWGIAVGAVALAALLVFTAMLKLQLDRTALERDRANEVARFFAAMFEDSNPMAEIAGSSGARAAITVREVLDREAPRIERELAGQPAVQATLFGSIGRVYDGLDQREAAERYIELALQRLGPADTTPTRERVDLLLSLCKIRGVRGRERTIEACDAAVAAARGLARSGDNFDLARALRYRGSALVLMGRLDDADTDFRAASAQFERLGQVSWVSGVGSDLANLSHLRGDPRGCLQQIEPVVVQWRQQFGVDHAILAGALSTRSNCNMAVGNAKEAEADLREALALVERAVGTDAPVGNRAQLLSDLALVLNQQSRYAEAEPLLREALAISERVYGPEHPEVGSVLRNLSLTVDGLGRVDEGIALLRRTLELDLKRGDDDRLTRAITQNNLGFRLQRERRFAEAEPFLRESLANYEHIDPKHPDRAASLINLGSVLVETARAAEALPLLREGVALREQNMQPGSWQIQTARNVLGACLVAVGQGDEGRALLQSSYEALLAKLGPEHKRTLESKRRLDAASAAPPGK